MSFCCAAESQFGPKVAERDLRRYRRRGADKTTRLMLAELRGLSLEGRHLWDVGGGIGVIISELADIRLASVAMVEASPAYLEVARREVGLKYGSRPVRFVGGDFALIAGTLPDADVVTLDRVVCCYPDAEALLVAAASRTRQVLAFTYPRDRWYVRTMFALANFWLRLTGKKFRAFVHAPEQMAAILEAAGLVRATRREMLVWRLDLYHRQRASQQRVDASAEDLKCLAGKAVSSQRRDRNHVASAKLFLTPDHGTGFSLNLS